MQAGVEAHAAPDQGATAVANRLAAGRQRMMTSRLWKWNSEDSTRYM